MDIITTEQLERTLADCVDCSTTVGNDADAFVVLIDRGLASARLLLAREPLRRQELHAAMLTLYSRGEKLSHLYPPELQRPVEAYRLLLDGLMLAAKLDVSLVDDEILSKIVFSLLSGVFAGTEDYHAAHGGASLLDTLRALTDSPVLFFERIADLAPTFDKKYQVALWQAELILQKRRVARGTARKPGREVSLYLNSLYCLSNISSNEWGRLSSPTTVPYDQVRGQMRSFFEDELGWLLQHAHLLPHRTLSANFLFLFLIVDAILGVHSIDQPWGLALCVRLKSILLREMGWYADAESMASELTVRPALAAVYKVVVAIGEFGTGDDAMVWLDAGMNAALRVVGNYVERQHRVLDDGTKEPQAGVIHTAALQCQNYLLAMALQKIALMDKRSDAMADQALVLDSEHWWIDFDKSQFSAFDCDMYSGNQLIWLALMERLSARRISTTLNFRDKMNFTIDEIICSEMSDGLPCVGLDYLAGRNGDRSKVIYGSRMIFFDLLSCLAATQQHEEQEMDSLFLACLVAGTIHPHSATKAAMTVFNSRLRQCLQPWRATA